VTAGAPDTARARLAELLAQALAQRRFSRLVLGHYRGSEPGLSKLMARELVLRGERQLSLLYRHETRDITRNLPLAEAPAALLALIDGPGQPGFAHALLESADGQAELRVSRKGRASLLVRRAAAPAETSEATTEAAPDATGAHDRPKHRLLTLADPCWHDLGLTDAGGRLIPAMSRKWKQINKFVEVLDAAWRESVLSQPGPRPAALRVMDFGAGKGYLTFAVHAHLSRGMGVAAEVTGIELRSDLVALCEASARRHVLQGLHFAQGDVMQQATGPLDVMIALHACDTATDHAIHKGLMAGAQIILCSPCCHKQLRPQLSSPGLLRPMLQHGIHLGQQAEMLTDSLRALLLEAHGYHTQVFEFVALEHTSKNKMILAVKRPQAPAGDSARQEVYQQIRAIKDFYGVREHCLELLLAGAGAAAAPGSASTARQAD
jgi:hypothetical protein